uniref:Uncharacterized protein n=1 Tax=Anguilla anguilla TaxID=7936 RepID=A0A0E9VG18_ANGAN
MFTLSLPCIAWVTKQEL